jgi:hypothetical protein
MGEIHLYNIGIQFNVVVCHAKGSLYFGSWSHENSGTLSDTGLPDFSWYMIPKPEKMYQINTKCTKLQ